jgi:hypothetical protein
MIFKKRGCIQQPLFLPEIFFNTPLPKNLISTGGKYILPHVKSDALLKVKTRLYTRVVEPCVIHLNL